MCQSALWRGGFKAAPRTSSLPSVPPNWPSAGTGVSPGPEGNPGGNLVRGKSGGKEKKQPKKRLTGNSTLSPDLNHSLSLLTFSMLCFWMILLLRLNFNLGNFSQLNLPDERMVLPAHDMILARRCFQWFNGSFLTIESCG